MGADFLRRCKAGVFQYVVVRFLLAVLTLFLSIIGCYEEGNYEYTSAYLWITGICCCSQSWALYSLFMFYHCSHKELITMRPFMKFLCLKMVIFFCWWQALAISMLVRLGHINSAHGHSVQEVADLIQDLLISMEMLVAAIAFLNSFPITEFAVVRQLNWGKGTQTALSLSTATISSDATGTLMYSEGMTNCVVNNSPNSEVGGFLPPGGGGGGGLFVETVACIAGSIIGNSNIINQRTIQSIPHPSLPVDKVPLITSDSSLDSFAPSPISDNEKSPATFSSRKVFLPYAIPMSKMDLTEKKIKKNKKDKIDINYNTEYFGEKDSHEDKIEVKEKDKSDFKSEKLLGLNFSSPLTVLRSAGYYPFSFQSLLPAFSFSFTKNSINKNRNDNKKINGKYNTLVSEGTGNASLKALSENNKKMNKVNIISKEGGSFHQKYNGKGVEMDDDVEASLLHQNSNLISDDSLIKETNYIVNQHNDDINLVKYNSRNGYGNGNGIGCSGSGSGGFVSIALTGCGPESTGRCNSPPFLPSPAARRKNNSTNKFSNDTNLVNAKMNMNSDASSDNSDGNDDIDNNSITNDKKFPRDGMAKCIPTSVSVSVSANYLSKETKRNISSTGYRSSPSISLPSSPCPHTLSPPPCTSTPIERDFLTFIPPNSGIIKSRNSAESFHRMNHSTMINKLLDKGSDESVSKKIDKNYQNLLPSFGAEYSHPSSTLFHGNKNRYLSSTSPAGNPSLNQTNINQNNSNNFNNLSNLNGLKRDLYPESEHQHQHQHNVVRDRSHSFDHELYPITTPATNYRMQSNNYNIESSKDYTADSLRGDDINYFQQFKEKDHFLGTKGVFGGIFCSYSSHFCFCFRFYFIFIFVT